MAKTSRITHHESRSGESAHRCHMRDLAAAREELAAAHERITPMIA